MSLWRTLANLATPAETEIGTALLAEYHQTGHIRRTCLAMLQIPDRAIAVFYNGLTPQPFTPHPGWMREADFCFINVRATGQGDQFGSFVQAAKLLPAIRANAIHLAPFTSYEFGVIYAISSNVAFAHQLIDPNLVAMGFNAAEQLRAFVGAAHALGKAVGLDVEPHVTQFAVPVLMHPELFRWIKLYAPDKRWLDDYQSQEDMLQPENQRHITGQVRALVQQTLVEHGLTDLEIAPDDTSDTAQRKQQVYGALIALLIERGFWTIPSQIWSGVGVPAFNGYNIAGNYPEFEYRNRWGQIDDAAALRVVTPFKFYDGLPVNRTPDHPPVLNPAALDYFSGIFTYWRDHFDLDFVRYDSADHIFDSTLSHDLPASDRPTPFVLEQAIARSKSPDHPYVGNLAERMGDEIEPYSAIGFDLILGSDMLDAVDRAHMAKSFTLYDRLTALNGAGTILYAVDTHDTGDPNLGKEPLVKREGSAGMLQRQFIARFLNCGAAPRPRYEVMGTQDLSYGLYAANVADKNLLWVGDETHNQRYHALEDRYAQRYRAFMRHARITERCVTDRYAWWWLESADHGLIALVVFAHAVESIIIPLGREYAITHVDFTGQLDQTTQGDVITAHHLSARTFRLFEVDM